jgi:hypothetical protein
MPPVLRPAPSPSCAPSLPLLHPRSAAGAGCLRFGRRWFSSSSAAAGGAGKEAGFLARESVELLGIPGVGPRNLRKLVDGGLRDLARLKQLYTDKVYAPLSFFLVCLAKELETDPWNGQEPRNVGLDLVLKELVRQ